MILNRLLNKKAQVVSTSQELDAFIRKGLSGSTESGENVTPDSALSVVDVYACNRVLAEGMAQLTLNVYRNLPGGGKEVAKDHPLHNKLHLKPNSWQSSFEWREMLQGHLGLRGNSYSFINRVRGNVAELLPIHPDRVEPLQDEKYNLKYKVRLANNSIKEFPAKDILHLRGLTTNGFSGLSPIQLHKEIIGSSMAAEKFGARRFKNGAQPSGVLKHPESLSDPAYERLKAEVKENTTGANVFNALILEEDMSWQSIGMTSVDAQYVEDKKLKRSQIAAIFRIPPHMIGDLEKATFSNITEQSLEFVIYSLGPWIKRWEQALTIALIPENQQGEYSIKFLVDSLLRGDIKTRYEAYAKARQWGWFNVDEIREMEDRNPLPDGKGKIYLEPLNMIESGEDREGNKNAN